MLGPGRTCGAGIHAGGCAFQHAGHGCACSCRSQLLQHVIHSATSSPSEPAATAQGWRPGGTAARVLQGAAT
eukprot:366286-Chlamydomonas_euryale.AAC.11